MMQSMVATLILFLSTLSLRRATLFFQNQFFIHNLFLSTLSLRRATFLLRKITITVDISIHALLAESDLTLHMVHLMERLFLSTLSLRRATLVALWVLSTQIKNFYPRSPCGERPL